MVSYATSSVDRTPSTTSTMEESNDSTAQLQASPSTTSDSPGRVASVRRELENQGISKDACEVILQSRTPGTHKQYNKPWRGWTSWCDRRACHLFQAPVNLFIDFLLEVYKLGGSYSKVNTYRSAISATIHSVTGRDLGSNHLVNRFMKGIYVAKPLLPRYTATWDVSKVTDQLRTSVPLESLSFKDLSKKLVLSLALSSAQRVQTLQALNINNMSIEETKIVFTVVQRLKTSRPGHNSLRVMIPKVLRNKSTDLPLYSFVTLY